MDTVSPEVRSRIMRAIKGKWTGPEILFSRGLARAGIRGWKCHDETLPGRPDFVFEGRSKVAIFINGCFFHGCPTHFRMPKSNVAFWRRKIRTNIERDIRNEKALVAGAWRVLTFWECQVKARAWEVVDRVRMEVGQ